MSKKSRKLLPFNPSEDLVRRLEQMASLATALTVTGTQFSSELTYVPGMAPRSANRAVLERDGMQVMLIRGFILCFFQVNMCRPVSICITNSLLWKYLRCCQKTMQKP